MNEISTKRKIEKNMNSNIIVQCPSCGKGTNSIKRPIAFESVIFLLVYFRIQRANVVACPECAYKTIHKFTFDPLNIILGNFVWLFLILPINMAALNKIKKGGHDENLIREMELSAEEKSAIQKKFIIKFIIFSIIILIGILFFIPKIIGLILYMIM